jgi:hypothetical protein
MKKKLGLVLVLAAAAGVVFGQGIKPSAGGLLDLGFDGYTDSDLKSGKVIS